MNRTGFICLCLTIVCIWLTGMFAEMGRYGLSFSAILSAMILGGIGFAVEIEQRYK